MDHIPILRLEVESMKFSILKALTEYTAQLDSDIKEAVEKYCSPDNIKRVINQAVWSTLDSVIKEEVNNWFTKGDGRTIIKEAVFREQHYLHSLGENT